MSPKKLHVALTLGAKSVTIVTLHHTTTASKARAARSPGSFSALPLFEVLASEKSLSC
ncbi:hypothetical protein SAMN05216567_13422 [Variovorax sp. OK605]|nr:hypothetical protein SAMN05216567_13422 [Variovorax sp. OK605]